MTSTKLIVVLVLVAQSISSWAQHANHGFYGSKEEGWFWYKDPREAKEKMPPPPAIQAPPVSQPPQQAAQSTDADKVPIFSVKWLRENMDKLRDAAIEDPSDDNVRAYYYAQRVMLDKADKFASASKRVVYADPLLDENNRFPFANAAKVQILRLRDVAKKEGLKYLAEKAGIWFFYDSKCNYCLMQVSVLQHLAADYGFVVKAISLDGKTLPGLGIPVVQDQGQFRSLGLTVTPTLVLAAPPKSILVVSQGVLSDASADDRLLSIAASQNLLPPEIARQIDVASSGVLAKEDLAGADKSLAEDPKAWVEFLQNKIKAKY